MIRAPVANGWSLVQQTDHASLCGALARHWKNERFEPPKPFVHVLDAIVHHDDSWIDRDANPIITDDGEPDAFTSSLDGSYSVFQGYEFEPYLEVREQAAATAARRDPYAAVLISMHTVDLLTDKNKTSVLDAGQREFLDEFIQRQRDRQSDWTEQLRERPGMAEYATADRFGRALEFLQACDHLSLLVCSDCRSEMQLHHEHPTTDGQSVRIRFRPLGEHRYNCDPWPFDEPQLSLEIPCRTVTPKTFSSVAQFRQAYADAETHQRQIELTASQ